MLRLPRSSFFLSLKWKALLLSSIALIAVTGALVTLNYTELRNQFEQRRLELQSQYARQVQGLLDQSSKRLQQWSTAIAALLSIQASKHDSINGMESRFEELATILELNIGVETIALVAADGRRLAAYGLDIPFDDSTILAGATRQVLADENPLTLIDCFNTCLQYAIAPVFNSGQAVVVGISLADVVLEFQRVSGTDLGLIVKHNESLSRNGNGDERLLPSWGVKVAALSNPNANMEILKIAADKQTLADSAQAPVYVQFNQGEHEVRLFPLAGFAQREEAYLAVVADIGDAMKSVRIALKRNLVLGVIGLVLSELLLLTILWPPMSRLRRAAAHLPWLAEGAFTKIRATVSESRSTHWLLDEVDMLNETAVALSYQLEALNAAVAQQTRDLSERMVEIIEQRNFVTHILETAQAIILTQDRSNRILMINPYGLALTGYSIADLQGQAFTTLLPEEESAEKVSSRLTALMTGDLAHFEEECDIRCKDHSVLNVVWQHSRLKGEGEEAPVVLSVGMDITARKKAERRLAWLADHDSLTGLYNRRRFTQTLHEAVAAAKRYRYSGALLFLDLDQFKYVNDTSGHHAGDQLLQQVGVLLPSILREVDVIGRLGGDEFAIILSQATAEEAIQVAKKILAHICEIEFSVDERVHKLSASIGIAPFPEHDMSIEELLVRADLAMYQVKESGRGNWYLLSNEDQSQQLMRERVFWKQQVEHAFKDKRFVLFVQPLQPPNPNRFPLRGIAQDAGRPWRNYRTGAVYRGGGTLWIDSCYRSYGGDRSHPLSSTGRGAGATDYLDREFVGPCFQ